MAERMLITKAVRTGARCDLYARGHQFKDLTLFDVSDLADVGIDFEALPDGDETPVRFWALYELSEKLNKAGNPYKNVIALEPVDKPATSTSTDSTALLTELRAIHRLLQVVAARLHIPESDPLTGEIAPPPTEPAPEPDAPLAYADGSHVSDNEAELDAYASHLATTGTLPASLAALRQWFKAQAAN